MTIDTPCATQDARMCSVVTRHVPERGVGPQGWHGGGWSGGVFLCVCVGGGG